MRLQFGRRKHFLPFLILIQIVSTASYAAGPQCQDLFPKKKIEIPSQHLEKNKFNIRRDLEQYSSFFSRPGTKEFEKLIVHLKPSSLWIDMGAGEARALSAGLILNSDLNALAVSYKRPENAVSIERFGPRASYIEGDIIENLYFSGNLDSYKGKAILITDLFGPLTYSKRIDIVLEAYLGLLKKDGELYFNLMDMVYRNHSPTAHNQIEINGAQVHFIEWIKTIPGIQVSQLHEKLAGNEERLAEKSTSYKITKMADQVIVPKNLKLTSFNDETAPPVRSYSVSAQP